MSYWISAESPTTGSKVLPSSPERCRRTTYRRIGQGETQGMTTSTVGFVISALQARPCGWPAYQIAELVEASQHYLAKRFEYLFGSISEDFGSDRGARGSRTCQCSKYGGVVVLVLQEGIGIGLADGDRIDIPQTRRGEAGNSPTWTAVKTHGVEERSIPL